MNSKRTSAPANRSGRVAGGGVGQPQDRLWRHRRDRPGRPRPPDPWPRRRRRCSALRLTSECWRDTRRPRAPVLVSRPGELPAPQLRGSLRTTPSLGDRASQQGHRRLPLGLARARIVMVRGLCTIRRRCATIAEIMQSAYAWSAYEACMPDSHGQGRAGAGRGGVAGFHVIPHRWRGATVRPDDEASTHPAPEAVSVRGGRPCRRGRAGGSLATQAGLGSRLRVPGWPGGRRVRRLRQLGAEGARAARPDRDVAGLALRVRRVGSGEAGDRPLPRKLDAGRDDRTRHDGRGASGPRRVDQIRSRQLDTLAGRSGDPAIAHVREGPGMLDRAAFRIRLPTGHGFGWHYRVRDVPDPG